MDIGLISLDGFKSPNLALMKISAYHKQRGDQVSFVPGPLLLKEKNYMSCIFSWNRKKERFYLKGNNIERGGYWLDKEIELPEEIEKKIPDYDLYKLDYSFGFTSRGCLNNCLFCIVHDKEGGIRQSGTIYDFWDKRHNWIRLLDNNFLASPDWKETLENIQKEGLSIDFEQGLDIRLINEENAYYLSKIKINPYYRFAFDSIEYKSQVKMGLNILRKVGIGLKGDLFFYLLIGLEDRESDFERASILTDWGREINSFISVFPMVYRNKEGKRAKQKGEKIEEKRLNFLVSKMSGPRSLLAGFVYWMKM